MKPLSEKKEFIVKYNPQGSTMVDFEYFKPKIVKEHLRLMLKRIENILDINGLREVCKELKKFKENDLNKIFGKELVK